MKNTVPSLIFHFWLTVVHVDITSQTNCQNHFWISNIYLYFISLNFKRIIMSLLWFTGGIIRCNVNIVLLSLYSALKAYNHSNETKSTASQHHLSLKPREFPRTVLKMPETTWPVGHPYLVLYEQAVMNGWLEYLKVTLRMKNRGIAVIENSLCNIRLAISGRYGPLRPAGRTHFSLRLTILFNATNFSIFLMGRAMPAISLC